jgi:hypothetical protein
MEFVIIGIVTALNILFIKKKFDKKRYEDGVFDLALLITITIIFSGSYGALVVGMVASLIISIAFYANPPKFIGSLFSKIKSKPLNIQELDNRFPDWNGKL